MESAIIAAVGRHGRDSHALVQGCALMFSFLTAPQLASQPSGQAELARELAAKIAASVGTAQPVQLISSSEDDAEQTSQLQILRQVAQLLGTRGVPVVDRPQGASIVTIACSQNLRERVCAARIRKGDASDIVMAVRPHDAGPGSDRDTPLALELHPLFGQRAPILDVAAAGDRLLVLDPAALTLYGRGGNGWQAQRSQPITSSRIWPRDLRGRLQVEGAAAEIFLPGVTCRASIEPFSLTCADEHQPWPIGIENSGVMPARNYFTTPEGTAFYGSAALAPEADARWLLVSQDGRLMLVDAERRPLETAAGAAGDGVSINVSGGCGPGAYVILSSGPSTAQGADTLRLFRVIARRLIPATSPVTLPGPLVALWAAPGASVATAVAADVGTGRYEAFQVDVSCGR
jgi:hypothetical protein